MLLGVSGLPERADFTGIQIQNEKRAIAPEINAIAPPFNLKAISGETFDLLALRGKPVIVNFWATWCEPCRVEMPALQRLYERYESQNLHILAVNTGESEQAVRTWGENFALTFDLLLDSDQMIASSYQLRGQPSTYVVSPDGVITTIFYGPVTTEALESAIAPYFSS